MKKKIRIVQCSSPSFWYSDLIGKEFEVINETVRDYQVSETKNILKIDADIVYCDEKTLKELSKKITKN